MKVLKRDATTVEFDSSKIENAILKAMKNGSGIVKPQIAKHIAEEIFEENKDKEEVSIYDIETLIFDKLISKKQKLTAKAYEGYRKIREFQRENDNTTDISYDELLSGTSEYYNKENSNKNAKLAHVQRDYMAGVASKDICRRFLLPPDIVQAHEEGIIHFHDEDYFAMNAIHNCSLINLEDQLQNGTVINGILIEKPHKFSTACTIATQIITAVASSQYGGCTINLGHLAPFVRSSYNKFVDKYKKRGESDSKAEELAKEDLKTEIADGVQTIAYQINSLYSTNGQSPFVSVFIYLGGETEYKEELVLITEEMFKQRILGMKNEVGVYITPAFPKLLYVLEKDNLPNGKYWWLTKLGVECSAKRMTPDYISEKKMLELKGDVYGCMGCRSFLTPDRFSDIGLGNISGAFNYKEGEHKYWGRFNQGVVTINLVDVALSSGGNEESFWQIFDERLELCHKALKIRHKRLLGTSSDVSPVLWQYGALARLKKHEPIDKLLYNGYSTISLGYAGLYECVKYMTGESHSNDNLGKSFGLKVMQHMNDKCEEWKNAENIDYSLYGTPLESTTYKFAKCLKKRFGEVEGITDRDYITNSYHIPVFEIIDAFNKLSIESEFQELSPGGAISYIEVASMLNNLKALEDVVCFIYDNIMYAEINTKSDYCQVCGYDGEILLDDNNEWYCPNCGNRDHDKMNVARRTCGYIGNNFWNDGRTAEIKDRVLHL